MHHNEQKLNNQVLHFPYFFCCYLSYFQLNSDVASLYPFLVYLCIHHPVFPVFEVDCLFLLKTSTVVSYLCYIYGTA